MSRIAPCGQHGGELLERLLDLHLGLALDTRTLEQDRQSADVVGAEDDVHPRGLFDDGAAILLCQTPAHRDLHAWVLALDGSQVRQVPIESVVGVLAHRAGVEDDDVRLLSLGSRHKSGFLEQARQPLGVVHVHLTPIGADLVGPHIRVDSGHTRESKETAGTQTGRCAPLAS